jgi:DNA uptake protein ComE-like DNA-binding protein
MSHSITHSPTEFEAVEKIGEKWIAHIFDNREQFNAWRKSNQGITVKPRSKKTRVIKAVDHRGEFIF